MTVESWLDLFMQAPPAAGQARPSTLFAEYLEALESETQADFSIATSDSLEAESLARFLIVDASHSILALPAWLQSRDFSRQGRSLRLHVLIQGPAKELLKVAGLLGHIRDFLPEQSIVIWTSEAAGPLAVDSMGFFDSTAYKNVQSKVACQIRLGNGPATASLSNVASQLDAVVGLRRADPSVSAQPPAESQASSEANPPASELTEQQFRNHLDNWATLWDQRLSEGVVKALAEAIRHSDDRFGARAEHFTGRLERFSQAELERDARVSKAAQHAMLSELRTWVEPRLGFKGRWFGIGAASCAACLTLGLVAGLLLGRLGV